MISKIGMVILNYNTANETISCIESFASKNNINECSVYIVDNGSADDSSVILEKYCKLKNYQLIVSKVNLGFSGGNNLGINQALNDGCDWILLSNSDIVYKSEILNNFDTIFKNNPDVCVIGPKIFDSDGNSMHRNQNEELTIHSLLIRSHRQCSENNVVVSEAFDGMVAGCVFALRSSFIREADCLDDSVFLYYEEDILLRQIRKHNRFAYICGDAEVVHIGQVSTQKYASDTVCFVRYYAWPSSVYTLLAYSSISILRIDALIIAYKIYWLFKSILSKQYSTRRREFFFELEHSKQQALSKRRCLSKAEH